MKKQTNDMTLVFLFSIITGAVIAGLIWAYLKIINVGITIIWEIIPDYLDVKYYTILVCLVGGLVVGAFHKFCGPYPENMKDSVGRVMKEGSYPYEKLPMIMLASFLPLFFGGAVGPEAGLVCLLLGLVFWALDQFGMARERTQDYLANDPYTLPAFLLKQMLLGYFTPLDKIIYDKDRTVWKKSESVACGVGCGLTALIVYLVLNAAFGSGLSVPHLEEEGFNTSQRLGCVLLILVGIVCGYLYLFFKKITSMVFEKIRNRNWHILNALIGALILGIIGSLMPMTMFSGGNSISTIHYSYLQYTPVLLIAIGLVKLFLTNVCIETGWRGGHFFPVIFAGVSIGYGVALLLGLNPMCSVVVVTASLLATMMQQPIGAFILSMIFFPFQEVGWIALASCIGGCLPIPRYLKTNPDDKGFIYNMKHQNFNKRIAQK